RRSLRRGFVFMRGAIPPHTLPARLGLADVRGLEPFRAASHLELNAVTLGQALEALSLDGAEVHEHVLAAFLGDESEALCVVEPLHCSLCHERVLFLWLERLCPVNPGFHRRGDARCTP